MVPFGYFQFLSRAVSASTIMAEMEVSPQNEMANPQGMKVFVIDRHGLPEEFVYFRALCSLQSLPLVFAPNRASGCDPLQGDSLFHVCALLS